jgi:hypothetical protein
VPGSIDTQVDAMNDFGQVTGVYTDSAGVSHGFIATPDDFTVVPEPSSLTLLCLGSLGLLGYSWRRRRAFPYGV